MSKEKTPNPAAFPWKTSASVYRGMSLRDYFAAQALTGIFAAHANPGAGSPRHSDPAEIAETCYKMADAMLEERAKNE